jgi:hypothetical protein
LFAIVAAGKAAALHVDQERGAVGGRDEEVDVLERPGGDATAPLLIDRDVGDAALLQIRLEGRFVVIVALGHGDRLEAVDRRL